MKSSRTFIYFLFLFFTYSSTLLYAQNKEITLEEIWGGEFSQERMQSLQSLKDGKSYIVQDYDRDNQDMKVDIYSYKTGEKRGTLVSSKSIPGLEMFQTFQLSADESKLILGTEVESIFRRSSKGIYYVYDLSSK